MNHNPIRLGVLGLGRAFTLMLPTFANDPRVKLVAAFDPHQTSCQLFAKEFGGVCHDSVESLCADPNVEWIYVATPHQLHKEHVCLSAKYGKHVLVEKPMSISIPDCQAMINACHQAHTSLIIGHSHSFNTPVLQARQLIESGTYGSARLITTVNFTDFMYRPRRPEELDTSKGGGVIFSQAAHQVDIVRLLAGGSTTSVYARTGVWDDKRKTEGAYTALLDFDNGVVANITYNGYGFFDSDVLMNNVGELGKIKSAGTHQKTRSILLSGDEQHEAQKKAERNYGGPSYKNMSHIPPDGFQHFGPIIVSCDLADLRLTPYGLEIHDGNGIHQHDVFAHQIPRREVIDELWSVARRGSQPQHGGEWSMATLEVCLAILESAKTRSAIIPVHQVSAKSSYATEWTRDTDAS
jgi:phthalate 4,5-cis-dihydrodiol dehydrogenase